MKKNNKAQPTAIVASAEVLYKKIETALTEANSAAVKKRESK